MPKFNLLIDAKNTRVVVSSYVPFTPLRQRYYQLVDLEECFSEISLGQECEIIKSVRNQIINLKLIIWDGHAL